MITRRTILAALATACVDSQPLFAQGSAKPTTEKPNADAIKALAEAYIAHSGDRVDEEVSRRLFHDKTPNAPAIQAATREDFAAGRMFTHRGWRMSHTEGRLFVLLHRTQ